MAGGCLAPLKRVPGPYPPPEGGVRAAGGRWPWLPSARPSRPAAIDRLPVPSPSLGHPQKPGLWQGDRDVGQARGSTADSQGPRRVPCARAGGLALGTPKKHRGAGTVPQQEGPHCSPDAACCPPASERLSELHSGPASPVSLCPFPVTPDAHEQRPLCGFPWPILVIPPWKLPDLCAAPQAPTQSPGSGV